MNDFFKKIILDKGKKRFKSLDKKKILVHQETFGELKTEVNEKKIQRDAMSRYQENKSHHKKSSNYEDYSQWDYFGQQNIQSSNNHTRRGHFPFGGTSQQHSIGWNPMGIGVPRQTNPYCVNPTTQVMPAHAYSDYRYNQWNNHKNVPTIQNAHSQNSVLPHGKMDIKHYGDVSNSIQDLGLPIGSTTDFSKFLSASRDLMQRVPTNLAEKTRSGIPTDHITSVPPGIRNSSIRTPPISNYPKPVVSNPLSDLHLLVSTQEGEELPQKSEDFQQESVDLSAHSENIKQKENLENNPLNDNNKGNKEFRLPVSVVQIQNKNSKSDLKESEKPVELTSKCTEKSVKPLNSSSPGKNDFDNKKVSSGHVAENEQENDLNKILENSEEPIKTSVIVGKDEESFGSNTKNLADITKIVQSDLCKNLEKESEIIENGKENENKKIILNECSNKIKSSKGTDKKTEKAQQCEKANEELSNDSNAGLNEKGSESSINFKRKAEDNQASSFNKKVFLETDSQPEKNEDFEKINSDSQTVTSTSAEVKLAVNKVTKKTSKKKPVRKSRIGRLSSGQSSGSERSLSCKKNKSVGIKEDLKKKVKKNLCDVMDRRGPFLHVEGSKESPVSVLVVNYPKGDDEDEKEKSSIKKQTPSAIRTKHHNELDYRGRSRNGLYSSTLSTKYDAQTTDCSWICVFCKKGPHYNTMGDLYGPYIISKDENTSLCDFSGDEKDISDAQKRGGRNKKSIRSNNMVEHFQKMSRKLRKTQSAESCLTGMTVISDDRIDQLRYEVWVHEQCAVWSPNVFLIGPRIIGMQEAIWCSVKTMCSKCGISGANIGCVYRNCPSRSHYHCAKEAGWSLEQKTFISTCYVHKPRS